MKKDKFSVTTHYVLRIIFIIILVCVPFYFSGIQSSVAAQTKIGNNRTVDYPLAWPGMLPDNKLYKVKVLRNKIIEKMLINPVKKVEFDLLMADKTIYASKILVEKGNVVLAKETVLKGENYYSMLVQDYNKALGEKKKIPEVLDKKITLAAVKHQQVFRELERKVEAKDKEIFQIVGKFSKINYQFIVGLRTPKKK